MANNKDFKVKNGIKPTAYHEAVGTVTSGTEYYNLANASYDSVSKSLASQNNSPMGLYFTDDGTQMFMVGASADEVNQYSLSTAWDVSTLTYVRVLALSESIPSGIFFKDDGYKMYIIGYGGDNVYEHTLTTAWDISTGTITHTENISSVDSVPFGLFFKPDGTKMYHSAANNIKLAEYDLSTAWDLSTVSFNQYSPTIISQPRQPFFTPDGLRVFIASNASDDVTEYSLSTAWDVSTLSYVREFDVSSQETNPVALFFKDDGSKMYVAGSSTDTVYQYSTALNTNTLDLSTGSVFEITPTSDFQIKLSNPAASGTVSQATLLLTGAANVTPYDLANAAYDSISLNVGTQGLNPYGLTFGDNGTKMYSLSFANDTVFQYTLSTAWDLSTASYASKSFSVTSTSPEPQALRFSSDGTKFYVTDNGAQEVNQYNCSTAWDVSTASHATVFSTSSQGSEPAALDFKTDGTKMYVAFASGTDSIAEYNLSTAWDLSTASYSQNSTTINTTPNTSGIMFKNDGTVLYTTSRFTTNAINEYSLSTAWDVSTLSYVQNFLVGTEDGNPTDLYIKPDGTKMYMVGYSTDYVYQYSLSSSVGYTVTYDSAIKWAGGTYGYFITPAVAPTNPALGKTDVMTFSTRDGGTSYQATVAIDGA